MIECGEYQLELFTEKGTAKDPAFMAWDEFELNQLEVIVTRESEADGKT